MSKENKESNIEPVGTNPIEVTPNEAAKMFEVFAEGLDTNKKITAIKINPSDIVNDPSDPYYYIAEDILDRGFDSDDIKDIKMTVEDGELFTEVKVGKGDRLKPE